MWRNCGVVNCGYESSETVAALTIIYQPLCQPLCVASHTGIIARVAQRRALGALREAGLADLDRGSVPHAGIRPSRLYLAHSPCPRRCGGHFAMRRSIDMAKIFRRRLWRKRPRAWGSAYDTAQYQEPIPANCTSRSDRRIHTCSTRRVNGTLDRDPHDI